jgi:hypothetical protein
MVTKIHLTFLASNSPFNVWPSYLPRAYLLKLCPLCMASLSTSCSLYIAFSLHFPVGVPLSIAIRFRCFFTLRRKKSLAERKIRAVSLLVADLERKVREAVARRRHDFKQVLPTPHCKEIWIYVFPEKKLRGLSPNFPHSCVCERSIYSIVRSTYFPAAE